MHCPGKGARRRCSTTTTTTRFPLRGQVIISRPIDLVCLLAHGDRARLECFLLLPPLARKLQRGKDWIFFSLLLRVLCSNRFRFLPSADSGRNASLEDTRKGAALVGGGGDASVSVASAAVGSRGEARAKEDDATGGAAGLPPVSSEEPANSTQESGVLSS
jgi:hypothetical protein